MKRQLVVIEHQVARQLTASSTSIDNVNRLAKFCKDSIVKWDGSVERWSLYCTAIKRMSKRKLISFHVVWAGTI